MRVMAGGRVQNAGSACRARSAGPRQWLIFSHLPVEVSRQVSPESSITRGGPFDLRGEVGSHRYDVADLDDICL